MNRVLVITRNSWNNGNSTGNTASNLFSNWDKSSIANLFCRAEVPNNDICNIYYRITESDLVSNLIKGKQVGLFATYSELTSGNSESHFEIAKNEKKIYDFLRTKRLNIFLWIREILWIIGKWKNDKLTCFLRDFNPDIVYMPVYDCIYMHKILKHVTSVTKAKVILFTGDDMYSLKQLSYSPFFWINRYIVRSYIRQSIRNADICYSMSDQQIDELKAEFGNKFKILRKCMNEYENIPTYPSIGREIKFVYTGNILNGRWKTLAKLAKAIQMVNKDQSKIKLYIYSANKLTRKMEKEILVSEDVKFMGSVDSNKIQKIQQEADILIHVESFDLKYRLQTRHSFSTKLVDYFQNKKCILAIGWKHANSIKYLMDNDAALVVTNEEEIINKIYEIADKPSIIPQYAHKSWECGIKNHHINKVQKDFYKDINFLIKGCESEL